MTVNISKPSINIREKLSELDKPSGIAGEAVLRADSVQEIRSQIGAGRKNLIINGGFDVWQRSTSASGDGYHAADRWYQNQYTSGTCSLSKRTDAVGQGFTTYARYEQSVIANNINSQGLLHYVEGSYAVGKPIVVSFKAKASRLLHNCKIRGAIAAEYFDISTEWQTFTFSGVCLPQGVNVRLMLDFAPSNTLWAVDIAEVQLELGSVATDFEHRSYGEELALCQRYYQRFGGAAYVGIASGVSTSATKSRFTFVNPVQMRATPSLSFSSLIATDRTIYDLLITNFSGSVLGAASSYLTCTHQGNAAVSKGALLVVRNGTAGYLAFSAEL